jgi:hypothetical protein
MGFHVSFRYLPTEKGEPTILDDADGDFLGKVYLSSMVSYIQTEQCQLHWHSCLMGGTHLIGIDP